MTNYIVENKDMLPFKDMSDEDNLRIVNACIASTEHVQYYIQNHWTNKSDGWIGMDSAYRVKKATELPTPLNIPWEHIHPQWQYAAMDKNGNIQLFTIEPTLGRSRWCADCSDYLVGSCVFNIKTDNINWELSLTKRQ